MDAPSVPTERPGLWTRLKIAMSGSWPFTNAPSDVLMPANWQQQFDSPIYIERPGGSVSVTQPMRQSAWVFACINANATAVASIPVKLRDRRGNEVDDHPLLDRLRRPNQFMGLADLIYATVAFLELAGESFWILDCDGDTEQPARGPKVNGIWPVHPKHWTPEVANGLVTAWKYEPVRGGGATYYHPSRIVFLRYFNPYSTLRGLAPMEAAFKATNTDEAAAEYQRASLENGSLPGLVLIPQDYGINEQRKEQLRQQWHAKYGGPKNANKLVVLPQDMKLERIGVTEGDFNWLEGRKRSVIEICAAFGIPPGIISVPDDANYSNLKEWNKDWYGNTIRPKARITQDGIQRTYVETRAPGYEVVFDFTDVPELAVYLGDLLDQADKAMKLGMPLNDCIRIFGLDRHGFKPQPWGDEWWIPYSLTTPEGAGLSPRLNPPESGPQHPPGSPSRAWPLMPASKLVEAWSEKVPVVADAGREAERAARWNSVMARHSAVEVAYKQDLVKFLRDTRNKVVAQISEAVKDFAAPASKDVGETIMGILRSLFDLGALAELIGLHTLAGVRDGADSALERIPDGTFYEGNAAVRLFMSAKRVKLAEELMRTTQSLLGKNIRSAIVQAADEGLDVRATAERVLQATKTSQAFSPARALTIARTETSQNANFGRYATAQQSGIERHEWISARDGAVRESHRHEDGNIVPIGEMFPVTGLLYPGDVNGPAQEVVNCRCVAVPVV